MNNNRNFKNYYNYQFKSYQIKNKQLYINLTTNSDIDFLSEFSTDFFTNNYQNFKKLITKIIKQNKINFTKGKVFLLVNSTIIATLFFTGGCNTSNDLNSNQSILDDIMITEVIPEINFNNSEASSNNTTSNQDNLIDETGQNINNPIIYKPMNLLLLAGHATYQIDPGAIYQDRYEAAYTFELVDLIKNELTKYPDYLINVILEPTPMALTDEITLLKNTRCDYVLSIHFNSGGGSGTEIIVGHQQTDLTIATEIINNFKSFNQPIRSTPIYSYSKSGKIARSNGVKVEPRTDYFGIIRNGQQLNIPSDIIEIEFIDNLSNMLFYDQNKVKYADAIAKSIVTYYLLNYQIVS